VALSTEVEPQDPQGLALLCQSLADLQLYSVLSPLEKLAAHDSPRVREAAVRVLGQFRFKRTFQTIRRALEDPDASVVQRAAAAIEQLHFPVALDPVSRIYRETTVPQARQAAIRAMADIERVEAAEVLLGIISHGSTEDRTCAIDALSKTRRKAFVQVARSAMADLDAPTRKAVRDVFKARGLQI
jgi:HEAT repeat protein